MRRFHIALAVSNLEASIQDYSARLGLAPDVVIPNEYALWRTPSLNFSIRQTQTHSGTLRHLGWEDSEATDFSQTVDCNGIPWELFGTQQQAEEIQRIWPEANCESLITTVTTH